MAENQRKVWLDAMTEIARPVLENLNRRTLHSALPLEFHADRAEFAMLEAFGRTMCGIAPWLEARGLPGEEEALQKEFVDLALGSLDAATDPASADFMVFDRGGQPLVDAAFLSHALIRAPKTLIGGLDSRVKENLIRALRSSRKIIPVPTNWVLFSAMVEAALYELGAPDYDMVRVVYAARAFADWYKGDGIYGDGAAFHWDYYNSFVIQPMYLDVVKTFAPISRELAGLLPAVTERAARYASVLERMIGADGTYPVIGRSVCYRFGAFQLLSQAALSHILEPAVLPAQVRCALTAVIRRVMSSKWMFDEKGWLLPGVCGFQPGLAEPYINRGSLYLCSAVFLALGLGPEDPFWSSPDADWTAVKIWNGLDMTADHAILN